MKFFIAISLLFSISYAKVYYAKVEPFEVREISSNISGLVVSADESLVGTRLSSEPYIRIDSEIDEKELKLIKEKLMYITNSLEMNEAILMNIEDSLAKKRENYRKIEPLKIKSTIEKDREFYDLITSENLFLNTKKDIQNQKIQIADLRLRKAQLERSIFDKRLVAKDFILYELLVRTGKVVTPATPLAKIADVSKAKLTLYLDDEDITDADKKDIYIDGEKTSYKISRSLNIADSKNISKYMAQVIITSPKLFSKLVKVEFKERGK